MSKAWANCVKSVKHSKNMDIKNHFLKSFVEAGRTQVNHVGLD